MKIVCRPKACGKTLAAIQEARRTDGYIVCYSKEEASRVFHLALEMERPIRFPLTLGEFLAGNFGPGCRNFIIDNTDMLIRELCRGVPVSMATFTANDAEVL